MRVPQELSHSTPEQALQRGVMPYKSSSLIPVARNAEGLNLPRSALGSFHEPAADGDPGCLGTVLGFELGEDGAYMELDRPLGDKEPIRDLGVLQAAGEEREHLEFPGGEAAVLGGSVLTLYAPEQPVRDGRLEEGAPGLDGADGAEDLLP